MRALPVVIGLLLFARAGTALAVCGDGIHEPPDEQCDGGACCSPTTCQFETEATPCRASAGPCDVAESCTGSDAACPVDAKRTGECRAAAGDCDVAESCDGVGDDCPADAFRPSTFPCRAALGICDVAENCTGSDATCPLDGKSTAVCRGVAGECDVAETCDGVADDCPGDAKLTSECRAAAGDCDVAESCDGVGDDCPADAFRPSTFPCRAALGICDVAENCTGSDATCPLDGKSTAVCRGVAGECDVAETCDGVGNGCPPDDFVPASFVCRPAAGACDAEERCSGNAASCPPDASEPNGTPCSDGDACTQTDACQAGACTGTHPVVCTPLDQCHVAGTCNSATGTCSNPVKSDDQPCNDGNACTSSDACHAGVCGGALVAGCCLGDGDCNDGVACTADQCVAQRCIRAPVADRCGTSRECGELLCAPDDPAADTAGCVVRAIDEGSYCGEDDDPCTIDACRTGTCEHVPDGSGSRCLVLVPPYRTALDLVARARTLRTAMQTAAVAGCARDTACELTPGQESTRLMALVDATQQDFETAATALAGRLAGPASPATPRDPVVRARLALGLLSHTPGELRAFLVTLSQARRRHVVTRDFARARKVDTRRLLTGTRKLRAQLVRLVARRQSFAR